MDRVSTAAAASAGKPLFGETNRDEPVENKGYTQRDASRTTGASITRDDAPGRYTLNQPAPAKSGLHPSTVSEVEAMEKGTSGHGLTGSGKMPGSYGTVHTAGSGYGSQTGTFTGFADEPGLSSANTTERYRIAPSTTGMRPSTVREIDDTGSMGRNIHIRAPSPSARSIDLMSGHRDIYNPEPLLDTNGSHPDTTMHRDTTGASLGVIGAAAPSGLASKKDAAARRGEDYSTRSERDVIPGHHDHTSGLEHRDTTDLGHRDLTSGRDEHRLGSELTGVTAAGMASRETREPREHTTTKTKTTASPLSGGPGDIHSVDAPPGPTRTEVTTKVAAEDSSASSVPGQPNMGAPSQASDRKGVTFKAGDDTSAGQSTVPGTSPGSLDHNTGLGGSHGRPGAASSPSSGDVPERDAEQRRHHQGSHEAMDTPSAGGDGVPTSAETADMNRHKSVPLIDEHPESSGPTTLPSGQKLPSGPGTGEGTGEKHVKSTGVAADGGDFDATAPGAGREALRLLDAQGVHHGQDKGPQRLQSTTPGKPSIGISTAKDHHPPDDKPSLGEKIKEKLHIGHH